MKYWDASALVPLFESEQSSNAALERLGRDAQIITLLWTRTEVAAAIERRTREGALSRAERRQVLARLDALAERWNEVADTLAVRS